MQTPEDQSEFPNSSPDEQDSPPTPDEETAQADGVEPSDSDELDELDAQHAQLLFGEELPPVVFEDINQRYEKRMRRLKNWAIFLFIATCGTTFMMGTGTADPPENWDRVNPTPESLQLKAGFTYAGCVMLILLFHEFGHYLQARRYGVPATLPIFIPMPNLFGTMGAVIVQQSGIADRKALFDIAISGPLAGLVIAIPCCYLGIQDTRVMELDPKGTVFGDPLIIQWLVQFRHGPLPENHDVIINPVLFAGWVGIFVTALNLIPVGQLDGGHILYTLIGKRAHVVALLLVVSAISAMIYYKEITYLLMLGLLCLMGTRHPPTADDSVPLGSWRIILGWLTLAFIVIGFTPRPLIDM
ncbi:MAG: site-2 protease family protein [Planctomycetaceae bacterium]|nr:site-2 protease family protein [Planctomycetaceae bacterium]